MPDFNKATRPFVWRYKSILELVFDWLITINTINSKSIIHLLIYTSWFLSDHPDYLLKCDQNKNIKW